MHIKDIKLYPDRLKKVGTMAYPLDYMDWGKYVSALTDIGYDGYICLEIEDKAFEKTKEDVYNSLILSKHYMENYIAG